MVRPKKLVLAIHLSGRELQRRLTQETLEARLRDLVRFLFVYILLVVFEQLILLGREFCWFECHLEAMCGLGWLFYILQLCFVNFSGQVKGVLKPSLLPRAS
jgi:hypothetical protein